MSDQQQPAGWYPAPGEPGTQRYWDGQQWTEHRQPMPEAQQPAQPAQPFGQPGAAQPVAGQPYAPPPPGFGPPGAVPPKQGGGAKWLIPVAICLVLAVAAVVIGLIATSGDDDDTADTTTTEQGTTDTTGGSGSTDGTGSTGTTAGGGGDTFTAGDYTFADVQVIEDFAGDFEVRTRATNNGETRSTVALTVTIFSGGSVVGTGSAYASDWEADSTITLAFISIDDYGDWDDLEFQVDSEF